jgi:hypothetical protein
MTQGCLRLCCDKNNMLLHTTHTAMEIPQAVVKAFDVLATYYEVLVEDYHSEEKFLEKINRHNMLYRLRRPSGAAALIVAAMPCFLEFVAESEERLFPFWTGVKEPYVLKIEHDTWSLYAEDGSLLQAYELQAELLRRFVTLRDARKQAELIEKGGLQ